MDNNEIEHAISEDFIYKIVLDMAKDIKGKILDAGARQGRFTKILARKNSNQIFACDFYPKHFRYKKIPCVKADLNNKLPFNNNFFDGVITISVLEHLENPWHFSREINRILKNKGKIIIVVPNTASLTSRLSYLFRAYFPYFSDEHLPMHILPLTPREIKNVFARVGFRLVDIRFPKGRIPKTSLIWQNFLPFLQGELFSDLVFLEFEKKGSKTNE